MNSTTLQNTQRFTGRAEDYDRFRQRYPAEEILAYLREWCGLTPQHTVADIGAGTGMLTEVFLKNDNPVIAIEPNADMRERMAQLVGSSSRLQIIDATAEATTLPSHSVDMVAAGRAFHWFNKDLALAEFRRILKPDGWTVLVSLGRNHKVADPAFAAQTAAFEHLLTHYGLDYNYVRSGYRAHEKMHTLFPGAFHQVQIPGAQQLDFETLRGQALSLSVVPQPTHHNFDPFQRELRSFFDTYASDNVLTLPTSCYITAGRLDAVA